MRSDRELLQAALTALEVYSHRDPNTLPIVNEIRARLAEPEEEPVAWITPKGSLSRHACFIDCAPLYRHPPRPTGLDQLLERIRFLEQQIAERKNQ